MALELSPISAVRELAVNRHAKLRDKHGSLIESCYPEAIRKAFIQHSAARIQEVCPPETASLEAPFAILKGKRTASRKFLSVMVRSIDFDASLQRFPSDQLNYCIFICDNLSLLSYGYIEEVLHVVHSLDKILCSTGVNILHELESKEMDNTNLTKAVACLMLVLQSRAELARMYNLSTAKCRAYNPNKLGSAKDSKAAIPVRGTKPNLASDELRGFNLSGERAEEFCRRFESMMANPKYNFSDELGAMQDITNRGQLKMAT